MRSTKGKWQNACWATLISAGLTIGPVAFIYGGFANILNYWQEVGFYIITIIGGGLSGLLGFQLSPGEKELKQQRTLVWIGFLFGILYIASSALCERLKIGMIDLNAWRSTGFVLICVGTFVRLWAIFILGTFHSAFVARQPGHYIVTKGPYRLIRHPSYLGLMIDLIGIPMVFGAWFPLLAMPGVFVLIKWRIIEEESFLIEEFGGEYVGYAKTTWRLLPRVF